MADTEKTRDQLIKRALKNLGQIEPGEDPSAEDYATVDDLVDPLLAQLGVDGIISIADANSIELEFYLPIARLLANVAGPDFGSPMNEAAKQADEQVLRRLTAQRPTFAVMKAEYF